MKKKQFIGCILMSIFLFSTVVNAKKIKSEYKIKASYVFNFIRFVTWPTQQLDKKTESVQVCVMNSNSQFNKAFKPVIGRKISGHPLRFKQLSDINNIAQCHLLYVDKSKKNNIVKLLPLIEKYKILFISDSRNFCAKGGMIGMVKRKGKIRLEINLKATKLAGFNISSNLLEVATIVEK